MQIAQISRLGSIAALILANRRSAASTAMVERFLSSIAVMIGVAVTLGLCTGALLIAGLYGTYRGLIENGLANNVAVMAVLAIMALIMALLILILREKVRSLREAPSALMRAEAPVVSEVRSTITAFMDGLSGRPSSHH